MKNNNKLFQLKQKIYSGSRKIIYQASEDFTLIMAFTDQIALPDGTMVDLHGKGVLNNSISAFIMQQLDSIGIDNHFICKHNMREQKVQSVIVFPIIVKVLSVACGRFVSDFGMEEGYMFDAPIIDFISRGHEAKRVAVNEQQIINFGWLNVSEITQIKNKAIRIYDFLSGLFTGIGIRLVECNLKFGRVFNGEEFIIMLADEISPDNCRLWNINNTQKLGMELITENPDKALQSYQKIAAAFKNAYFE